MQALKSASTLPSMESNFALSAVLVGTDIPLKMALFTLQKHVKESDFAVEFMLKGGMSILVRIIERDAGGLNGNSLAVSAQGIRLITADMPSTPFKALEASWSTRLPGLILQIDSSTGSCRFWSPLLSPISFVPPPPSPESSW